MGVIATIILLGLFSFSQADPLSHQDYGLCSQIYVMHQYCTSQLNPTSTSLSRPASQPRVGKAGPRGFRGPRGIVNYTAIDEKMAKKFFDWEERMEEKFLALKNSDAKKMQEMEDAIANKSKEYEESMRENFTRWRNSAELDMEEMKANLTKKGNEYEASMRENFTRWKNSAESEMEEMKAILTKNENGLAILGSVHKFSSCEEAQLFFKGSRSVVKMSVNGRTMDFYCDMATDGGNWTVFQRRVDGSVDFYRNWEEYASGFGNKNGEFWLGLETIHQLTQDGEYELRVDLTDWGGSSAYAKYRTFSLAGRSDGYRLTVGGYSGTAGDSMTYHNGQRFSAKDKDLDSRSYENCATRYHAAWWFGSCAYSSLNGRYNDTSRSDSGVWWYHWGNRYYHSLKSSEMKFRKK